MGIKVDFTPNKPEYLGECFVIRVYSESDPSKWYLVVVDPSSGYCICSCPGFSFREKCKHTEAAAKVKNFLSE